MYKRQDDVQAEDVFGGDAVLDAAQTAGGGADVAADRALFPAGGVGRVVQAVFGDGAGEDGVDDAGLDDGDPLDRVDLEDAVHLDEREDDAAVGGVGRPGQPGAGPLRNDGDAQRGGGPHDVLHLLDGAGQDDDGGGAALAEARHVGGVGGGDVGVGEDRLGGESFAQQLGEITHDPTLPPHGGRGKITRLRRLRGCRASPARARWPRRAP